MSISIDNVVTVTVTAAPGGISSPNINSVGLFTHETPSNIDPFRIYLSASDVGVDYGTTSITFAMATAIFSQSPNVTSGGGRLVIVPLIAAVSATPGDNVGVDISANLTALQAVSDGDLEITIDGVVSNLTGLNFTSAVTLADIATVIESKIGSTASVTEASDILTVTSKTAGTTSTILVDQLVGSGTDLSVVGLLNVAAGASTDGINSSGETLTDAIIRANNVVQYVGFMTTMHLEDAAISAVAYTDKMFLHHIASSSNFAGIATTIKDANKTTVRLLGNLTGLDEARLFKASYAGRGFSVLFSGTDTTITMHMKSLVGVGADSFMTETLKTLAFDAGVDILPSIDNRVTKVFTSGANNFFDDVYNEIAIKNDFQTAEFNVLAQTNNKVPQTTVGMQQLVNAASSVCNKFVTNRYLAPGTWSGATFGNSEDFLRLIDEQGYYIFYLPLSQQTQEDRDNRIAPILQIAIKTAGAIHKVFNIVNVEK